MINIFPKFGSNGEWIEFDAVLTSSTSASVSFTEFPVESGVIASDHGIIQPKTFTLQGGISSNPLKTDLKDFAGGFFSNFVDGTAVANVAGLSAGFLAGSEPARPSAAVELLYRLMYERMPLDVFNGLILIQNLVITNIEIERNPKNEGGAIFDATLKELITIDRIGYSGMPETSTSVDKTAKGDAVQTQGGETVNKGTKSAGVATETTQKKVEEIK